MVRLAMLAFVATMGSVAAQTSSGNLQGGASGGLGGGTLQGNVQGGVNNPNAAQGSFQNQGSFQQGTQQGGFQQGTQGSFQPQMQGSYSTIPGQNLPTTSYYTPGQPMVQGGVFGGGACCGGVSQVGYSVPVSTGACCGNSLSHGYYPASYGYGYSSYDPCCNTGGKRKRGFRR